MLLVGGGEGGGAAGGRRGGARGSKSAKASKARRASGKLCLASVLSLQADGLSMRHS